LRVNGEEDSRFLLAGATGHGPNLWASPYQGRLAASPMPPRPSWAGGRAAGLRQRAPTGKLGSRDRPKGAAESRDEFAARMTPAQIAEAEKLAREWKIASR
jgi:hypothetical protein